MFTTIAVLATASCAAALLTGSRVIGLKKIVKHSTKVDVAFTAGIGFALAGTLTGLATAIVAGLMMALILSFLKTTYAASDWICRGVAAVKADRENRYAEEHNAEGWVYNQAPYV